MRGAAPGTWTALALALAACLDPIAPEVGPLIVEPCSDEDSDPSVEISWSEDLVVGIFSRPEIHCARCHTPDGATPIGLQATGFDVSSLETIRRGGANTGAAIIVPGSPCSSLLVGKLGPAPPIGERMPLTGPPFLSQEELQSVRDWIAEGARDN